MKQNEIFNKFNIVNVAGDGDEEEENEEALRKVENAITDNPENTYSITISCGRLTTGVSVPAWTAVLMMAGTYSTSASSYLQTIFRVQTPANINGKIKEKCYVFDFAPDRTLKMVAEAVSLNTKAGKTDPTGKQLMGDFLNFCPVVAIQGSQMITYDVNNMLQQLKKAYAERVVKNGFDDTKIYNDNLLKLDGLELDKFKKLEKIIGASKQSKKVNEIDINGQGFNAEEHEKIQAIEKKPPIERTQAELELLKQRAEKKKQKDTAISILRGISIRIPLMIYGADIDVKKDITPENFTEIIDDKSWEEFMPKGVTKDLYKEFVKYYDEDIFITAGRNIRNKTKGADDLPTTERIKRIAEIFSSFKNPDKETVLTPWRVVNMHLGDCIGGYNFFEEFDNTIPLEKPRYIEETLPNLFNNDKKILEINSKTGLYPLYVAYSFYQNRRINKEQNKSKEEIKDYWQETLKENIYVICKTKMAKTITKRTLVGYKDYDVNIIDYEDIIDVLKNKPNEFIDKILTPKTWNKDGDKMKFDCIVGNPPYQEENNGQNKAPIYDKFVINSIAMNPDYISMIMPSRWLTGGNKSLKTLKDCLEKQCNLVEFHDFEDSKIAFPGVSIDGGICYFLIDKNSTSKGRRIYSHFENKVVGPLDYDIFNFKNIDDIRIVEEVWGNKFDEKKSIINRVSKQKPFSITSTGECNGEKLPLYLKKKNNDDLRIFAKEENGKGAKNTWYFTERKLVPRNSAIDEYKVFVSIAGHAENSYNKPQNIVNNSALVGLPGDITTETKRVISLNKSNLTEAKAVASYVNTKFFRRLMHVLQKSLNSPREVYLYVPDYVEIYESLIKTNGKDALFTDEFLNKYFRLTKECIEDIEKRIAQKSNMEI